VSILLVTDTNADVWEKNNGWEPILAIINKKLLYAKN